MRGGDRRLEDQRSGLPGVAQDVDALGDQPAIPTRAVGVGQQHLAADGVEARCRACLGQQDEGQQAGGLAVAGPGVVQRAGQPLGVGGELGAAQLLPGPGGVAHRVGQVDRPPHRRHALLDGHVVG